jgi:two-component system response regulator AtoC
MTDRGNHSNFFHDKEVLLLEDETLLAKRITAVLENMGAEVTHTVSMEEARKALKELSFDCALFDLNLPDGESLDLLKEHAVPENTLVVLMTGEGGVRSAVEALRLGASDYLSKPFDLEELPLVFSHADAHRRKRRIREHDRTEAKRKSEELLFDGAFSQDLVMLEKILDADNRLASNLPPILIEGPTGSGKSTYARWIHENGPRSDGPWVEVNCSAIPDNLAESELFGHEKGAFTDAKGARIGLFEAADHGTLFLDEIASLSTAAQAKVLVAIENGKIRRLGGNKEIQVDVRVITAANQDLREMIKGGAFREDLYHRLDLLRMKIPPLAQREEGILLLARHFLSSLSIKYNLPMPEFSDNGEKQLLRHSWPGNARELAHELERSLVMHDTGKELTFNGNVSEAARLLGVPRDYIRYRLQKKDE